MPAIRADSYKIQLKRTAKTFEEDSDRIANTVIDYGEPAFYDDKDYLIIGKKQVAGEPSNKLGESKVIKAVNRLASNNDVSENDIEVADNPVFKYHNVDGTDTLLDEDANVLNPRTTLLAVTDDGATDLATIVADKVDIDSSTSASYPFPSLGKDDGGVYVDERQIPDPATSPMAEFIAQKVSIDDDSSTTKPVSMGRDMVGAFVRTNEQGDDEATNFLKAYINQQIAEATKSFNQQILNLQNALSSMTILIVSENAPDDINKLWLDRNASSGGLKYYDSITSTWKHVPVSYT